MIIVEGPDGAGKTTLIKKLVNHYGMKVGKRGTDNRDLLYTVTVPDTFRAIRGALNGGDALPTLWDRLYFSDLVYAPVQKREVAFNREERYFIEQTINALDIPVILCLPPWETVKANEAGTEQMEGVHDNLHKIYHMYSTGFIFRVPTYMYDYTSTHFESLTDQIDKYLYRKKRRKWYQARGGNS